jgi:hypothetical protein
MRQKLKLLMWNGMQEGKRGNVFIWKGEGMREKLREGEG